MRAGAEGIERGGYGSGRLERRWSPSGRRARVGGCRRARAVASHLESERSDGPTLESTVRAWPPHVSRLEQRHPRAVTVREVGRGQTRDPGADDRDRAPPVVPPLGARAGHLLSQHRREECAAGKARRRARAGESAAGFRRRARRLRAVRLRRARGVRAREKGRGRRFRVATLRRVREVFLRAAGRRGARSGSGTYFSRPPSAFPLRDTRALWRNVPGPIRRSILESRRALPRTPPIFSLKPRKSDALFESAMRHHSHSCVSRAPILVVLHADAPSPAASRTPARAPRRDAGFGRRARVRRVPGARARVVARRVVRRGGLLRDASW